VIAIADSANAAKRMRQIEVVKQEIQQESAGNEAKANP